MRGWEPRVQSDRLLQSEAQAARRQLEVKLTRLQESRTDKERYLQEHELRMLEYEREEEAMMIAITRLQRQLTTQDARGEGRQAPQGRSMVAYEDDYELRNGQQDEYELEDKPLKVVPPTPPGFAGRLQSVPRASDQSESHAGNRAHGSAPQPQLRIAVNRSPKQRVKAPLELYVPSQRRRHPESSSLPAPRSEERQVSYRKEPGSQPEEAHPPPPGYSAPKTRQAGEWPVEELGQGVDHRGGLGEEQHRNDALRRASNAQMAREQDQNDILRRASNAEMARMVPHRGGSTGDNAISENLPGIQTANPQRKVREWDVDKPADPQQDLKGAAGEGWFPHTTHGDWADEPMSPAEFARKNSRGHSSNLEVRSAVGNVQPADGAAAASRLSQRTGRVEEDFAGLSTGSQPRATRQALVSGDSPRQQQPPSLDGGQAGLTVGSVWAHGPCPIVQLRGDQQGRKPGIVLEEAVEAMSAVLVALTQWLV